MVLLSLLCSENLGHREITGLTEKVAAALEEIE